MKAVRKYSVLVIALVCSISILRAAKLLASDEIKAEEDAIAGVIADTATGVVTGIVRYPGKIPRSWMADPAGSQVKSAAGATPMPAEPGASEVSPPKPIQLNPDGSIRGVVVALLTSKSAIIKRDSTPELAVVDQAGSVFWPQVLVIPEGGKVVFKNSDAINHNVHLLSQIQGKNFYLSGDQQREIQFRRADKIRVTCDIHAWMRGTLIVAPTSFYTITDDKGRYTIQGVPPGEYRVDISHYRFSADPENYKVQVKAGAVLEVDVSATRSRWKN